MDQVNGRTNKARPVAATITAALMAGLLAACGSSSAGTGTARQAQSNLTSGCVRSYHKGVDYFPAQVRPAAAAGFEVSYHDSYKVVTVNQPYQGGKPVSYVLVQCGTPAPKLTGSLASAEVVQIPVHRVDAESTTQLPDFDLLGSVGVLVGVAATAMVNTPSVVARIKAGKITQFEATGTLNTEQVLATTPDLFLTQGVSNPAYAQLQASGVKVVADADYLSSTPLARAQWIEFVSLFLNKEAQATRQYGKIAGAYDRLVALAANVTDRPTTLEGDQYQGTWYAAAGNSYVGALLRDAGADYVFAGNHSVGSLSLSMETILHQGSQARFCVDADDGNYKTIQQAYTVDPRYRQLACFRDGNVWEYTKDVNAGGGNDYFEEGVVRPDLVLGDLIAIFHPSLEPHHTFTFYEKVPLG
jgi:iron complex transport system substrate-binding protein